VVPGKLPKSAPLTAADLASRWLGGCVMAASDDSFGEKEHLLSPAPATFEPARFGPRGQVVDGWETRRRRDAGHDWALIRLGAPGIISAVDIDTSFFTGNHPVSGAVEACGCEGYPGPAELAGPSPGWTACAAREWPLRWAACAHVPCLTGSSLSSPTTPSVVAPGRQC